MKDMLGRGEAVSVEEALRRILDTISDTPGTEVLLPLNNAYGRVLSCDIVSPEDLPCFDRSTMDGYALRSADTFGASETAPAYLNITSEVLMGEEPGFELKEGDVCKIATGGMLPRGADAVLMLEYAQVVDDGMIEAQRQVAPGENVVARGEDVKRAEPLFKKGHRLRPLDVSVLAALGLAEVSVYELPQVAIISTGDEIVPPETPLRPGLVRDSNSYALAGLIAEDHAVAVKRGIIKDNFQALRDNVAKAVLETDMVLITGGSSVGTRDMTERVIRDLGRVLFHSVTLKPGKPLLAGVVDETPVFGLPGHPRAVSVCYELFVRPALNKISGCSSVQVASDKRTVMAKVTKSVHSSLGRQENISVELLIIDGELWARPLLGKSGLITTMVKADGSFDIPSNRIGVEKEERLVIRLY